MSRPIFTARVRSNPFGVFLLSDFESLQIGTSPTGTAEDAAASSDNPIIQVKNDLYFQGGGVLYKYNKSTTNWDILYHPIGMPATNRAASGLHLANLNGVPYLCWIVGLTTSQAYRGIKLNLNTGAVTETGGTGLSTAGTTHKRNSIIYNNVIFWNVTSGNLTPILYNPSTETLVSITVVASIGAANGNYATPWCIWNKFLYSGAKANGSDYYLVRYTGSNFINVASIDINANLPATTSTAHAYCMFTDKTYLYAIYLNSSNSFKCVAFDSSFNKTDITTSVLPTAFTSASTSNRMWPHIDNEDNPTNPDIYLYTAFTATAGQAVSKYKWNGSGTLMTLVGAGGDLSHSFSSSLEGAGHRTYTTNELDILISSVTQSTVAGASRIAFNVYESIIYPSGYPINVKIAYDTDLEHTTTFASLSNPLPSGTITGGNTITGIIAGSGINYTVDWMPTLNSVTSNTYIRLTPWVSGVL